MSSSPRESAASLRARALRHLARREHSRAELERKLSAHAEGAGELEALLDELQSKGQLSNARFAEGRARILSRKYGAARIRQDLRGRGVAEELIQRALPGDEIDRAKAILARRYRTPAASREERARRARFLQARGFSAELVHRLIVRDGEAD